MDAKPNEYPTVSPWLRLIVRALAWGAGCGLGISLVLLAVYFYMQRPKGWDTGAVRARSAEARSLGRLDEHLGEVSSGTTFSVDLENATGEDVTLPSTVRIMQSTKNTGALRGSLLKLDYDYFLPAHHVVSIRLANDDLCAGNRDPQDCFDAYFKDDGRDRHLRRYTQV